MHLVMGTIYHGYILPRDDEKKEKRRLAEQKATNQHFKYKLHPSPDYKQKEQTITTFYSLG